MFNQKSVKWSFLIASVLILAACGEVGPSPSLSSSSASTSLTSSESSSEIPSEQQFQIYLKAQQSGYTGTYEEWLASIKGADGTALLSGTTNPTSSEGKNGDTFVNTITWDVFVKSGGNWTNVGNIMGPKGDKGDQGEPGQNGTNGTNGINGQDGLTPFVGNNGNWWIGTTDTGISATGPAGENGTNGTNGINGQDGLTPFVGNNGNWWIGTTDTGISATGPAGENGTNGTNGVDGLTPFVGNNGNWWIRTTDTGTSATGPAGENGTNGNGIAKIEKISTVGNVDTYQIIFTDGTTFTYAVTNGTNGTNGIDGQDGKDGMDGEDGEDGLSSYEIYKKYYPGYPGTEQEWINDLARGQLAKSIIYNFNGGSNSEYQSEYLKGEKIGTLPITTKQYYTFDGWEFNGQIIDENFYVVDHITISAKWTINEGGIQTAQDLINIKDNLSGSYFLINDIDLIGIEWTPIGNETDPFTGTIDGRGYTIKNLKITTPQNYVGFIGYNEGVVKNLSLAQVEINIFGSYTNFIYGGSLIGFNDSSNSLDNLHTLGGEIVVDKSSHKARFVGGLIGYQKGNATISFSSNNVNIYVDGGAGFYEDETGGLVGHCNSGAIMNSFNNGSVNGYSSVGGLVGLMVESALLNSYNKGFISGITTIGGLIGDNRGSTITNSYNKGVVNLSSKNGTRAGGLVGFGVNSTFTNSFNSGSVTGGSYSGGILGYGQLSTTIFHSYNFGLVIGSSGVGGLVGYSTNSTISIIDSFNLASISADYCAGGILGDTFGIYSISSVEIFTSFNKGEINSENQAGGLVGCMGNNDYLSVVFSINFGNIDSVSSNEIGGITGFLPNNYSIEQTYYSGSITSNGVAVDGVAFGTKVTDTSTFNLAFFTTTLEWDTEIWDFEGLDISNGVYPTLKNMPVVEE
jgi:hypothetical protein